jgi:hypothetical protein
MKSHMGLCLSVLLGVGVASFRPAYGCLEMHGQEPVKLPMCVGNRATGILNRAIRSVERTDPLRIEMINNGRQTNFAIHGTRACAGSMTSPGGTHYTGTWSYTRINDYDIQVNFSLQPAP